MIALCDRLCMTLAQYLDWEPQQLEKYEYLNGEAYAMTGGTIPHNRIAINLIAALHPHLRDRGCLVLGSDAKVVISESGPSFYPDVVVTCDPRDRTAIAAIRYPSLIIEVLSPGTESFDRGDKFRFYRSLPSLQEYALINSDRPNIEIFRLNTSQKWELTAYEAGDSVALRSLDFTISIDLIYEDVTLPTSNSAQQSPEQKLPILTV